MNQQKGVFWRRATASLLLLVLFFSLGLDSEARQVVQSDLQPVRNLEKISSELMQMLNNAEKDDIFSVLVWQDTVPSTTIDELLLAETGLDSKVYQNRSEFNELILPTIKQRVYEQFNMKEPPTEKDASCVAYQDELLTATVAAYDHYWIERREIVKREHSAITDHFVEKIVTNKDRKIIFKSQYTPAVILEATAEEIMKYAELPEITKISLYVDCELTNSWDVTHRQIVDTLPNGFGFQLSEYHYGHGQEIKVGIIEADCGKIQFDAPMLASHPHMYYSDLYFPSGGSVIGVESEHATMVASIIAGTEFTFGDRTFCGLAPAAEVYQVPTSSRTDFYQAFETLVSAGVSVINFSGGSNMRPWYTEEDRVIDCAINNTGVILVAAAGNNDGSNPDVHDVDTPAKGYNVIAVGNAVTKDENTVLSAPYSMHGTSCYGGYEGLPNKPDLCAPGTKIAIPVPSSNSSYPDIKNVTGTSFAAPMVTGTIALMLRINPSLMGDPTGVKAILLASADQSLISQVDNPEVNPNFRCKSGAGLLDTGKALECAYNGCYATYNYLDHSITQYLTNCTAGDKIRVALTFSAPHDGVPSYLDDYNLLLRSFSYPYLRATSTAVYENVEVIEYEVVGDGGLYAEVVCSNLAYPDEPYKIPTVSIAYSAIQGS